jgi:hypothetical protein
LGSKEGTSKPNRQHVAGGSAVLEARNMTFAALAEHCKETRYCEAFYDEQGRKLYGVREPKKFASMITAS